MFHRINRTHGCFYISTDRSNLEYLKEQELSSDVKKPSINETNLRLHGERLNWTPPNRSPLQVSGLSLIVSVTLMGTATRSQSGQLWRYALRWHFVTLRGLYLASAGNSYHYTKLVLQQWLMAEHVFTKEGNNTCDNADHTDWKTHQLTKRCTSSSCFESVTLNHNQYYYPVGVTNSAKHQVIRCPLF